VKEESERNRLKEFVILEGRLEGKKGIGRTGRRRESRKNGGESNQFFSILRTAASRGNGNYAGGLADQTLSILHPQYLLIR
jgi:hypothetical protein